MLLYRHKYLCEVLYGDYFENCEVEVDYCGTVENDRVVEIL